MRTGWKGANKSLYVKGLGGRGGTFSSEEKKAEKNKPHP